MAGRKRTVTITEEHIAAYERLVPEGDRDARLLEIARRVVAGESNASIGRSLGLSRERIGQLVRLFLRRANAESGQAAVLYALLSGFVALVAALLAAIVRQAGASWMVTLAVFTAGYGALGWAMIAVVARWVVRHG